MNELREYLEFIRPWSDQTHKVVMATWGPRDPNNNNQKNKLQRGTVSIDDVEQMLNYYANKGEDVWFATQTYNVSPQAEAVGNGGKWFKKVSRRQHDVQAIHSFYCDLDVKPGAYASLQDAVNAIFAFCGKLNMPPPSMMVCSGYGLHCYWRTQEDMTLHQWQPVAAGLRGAMLAEGIMADHGCTIDSARVLRPPGTVNYKDPANPVATYIIPGSSKQTYQLEWIAAPLRPFMGPHLATIQGKLVGPVSKITQNLSAGIDESQPVSLHDISTMCAVFADQFQTSGKHASQPLWSLVALASAFDKTPWETFEELSDGHPGYVEANARNKLNEKLQAKASKKTGWPSCQAFSVESSLCQTCPHFPLGKSPLHLKIKPTVAPGVLPTAAPNLPPQYWQNTDGTIWTNLKDADGKPVPAQVALWPIGEGAIDDETGELVFACMLGSKRTTIRVHSNKARNQDLRTDLFSQGFISQEFEAKKLGEFIVAWITHLRAGSAATMTSAHLGWDEDGGFTHGETRWVAGIPNEAIFRDKRVSSKYITKGTIDPWKKAVNFATSCGNPGIEVLVATAFAAPLIDIVSSGSVMLSPYSKLTSAGKTTFLRVAQATWGHPIRASFGLNDSSKSVDKAFGDVRNLPIIWDEIRTKATLEDIVAQAFRLGQGKGRTVLHSDRSTSEGGLFKTMLIAASNYSLAELITSATNETDAGAQRVFEIELKSYSDHALDTMIGDMTNVLESNYGHAGVEYAAFLSRNRERITKEMTAFNKGLAIKCGATGGERFWIPLISSLVCGANYANEIGLTHFNVGSMLGYLIEQLNILRTHRDADVKLLSRTETLEELVHAFLTSGEVIFTNILGAQNQQVQLTNNQGIEDVKRMKVISGQYATTTGRLRLAWSPFSVWLKQRGQSPRSVKDALKGRYGGFDVRATLGAGVAGFSANTMRTPCVEFDTRHLQIP